MKNKKSISMWLKKKYNEKIKTTIWKLEINRDKDIYKEIMRDKITLTTAVLSTTMGISGKRDQIDKYIERYIGQEISRDKYMDKREWQRDKQR